MIFPEIEEDLLRCMRCGECQAVCPTYAVTGREGEVARGKVRIIRGLLNGELDMDQGVADKLSTCLLCKSCCTACPSGVRVDKVITAARKVLAERRGISLLKSAVLWGLEHPMMFSAASSGARVFGILPRMEVGTAGDYEQLHRKGRVVFYAGCMTNYITPEIGEVVEQVLRKIGYRVERIKESCCGIPAYYAGLHKRARKLAERNLKSIKTRNRALITACPTCAVGLRGYPDFFRGKLREKALELSSSTYDFAEFIAATGTLSGDTSPLDMRVTFHDPCHAIHGLGITREPRRLITSIPGIKLVEMEKRCCGFGGLFSLEHKKFAKTINNARLRDIAATKAEGVVTSCPGCKHYLLEGLRRGAGGVEVLHIAELIRRGLR